MKKYLVIGLGSMGKRRVRCLKALGIKQDNIYGMDVREDRCRNAKEKYGIIIVDKEEEIDFDEVEGVIVSLPPDMHLMGVDIAVKHHKPVFVEASVILSDVKEIRERSRDIFVAPSCTFVFHPMIKEIKKIVKSGELGKVCNFSYHSGQYLPDWHPWENVKDFYVSNRMTGGAREIVPYELTWITDVFGFPKDIKGYFRKTGNIGCNIEDSYASCLLYGDMVGTLLVDVVSRYPSRNLIINFEHGQVQWRWDREQIEIYNAKTKERNYIKQVQQKHENEYSAMIGEDMYIEEIVKFVQGMNNPALYPNTLEKDIEVLSLLEKIEISDGGFER
jgi:hypothetical protein